MLTFDSFSTVSLVNWPSRSTSFLNVVTAVLAGAAAANRSAAGGAAWASAGVTLSANSVPPARSTAVHRADSTDRCACRGLPWGDSSSMIVLRRGYLVGGTARRRPLGGEVARWRSQLLPADGDHRVLGIGHRDVRGLPGVVVVGDPYCFRLMAFWCQIRTGVA